MISEFTTKLITGSHLMTLKFTLLDFLSTPSYEWTDPHKLLPYAATG